MDRTLLRRITAVTLLVLGVALIPLPGPGWPMVFISLAMLGLRPPGYERMLALAPQWLRDWADLNPLTQNG